MTQTHSRSRQQAEVAFGKIQTEFFAGAKPWMHWIPSHSHATKRPPACGKPVSYRFASVRSRLVSSRLRRSKAMTDPLFEQAWRVGEELRSRVDLIDGTRLTPGMMVNLAAGLSVLAAQLRPSVQKATLTSSLDL
jgi:hypothetical protein